MTVMSARHDVRLVGETLERMTAGMERERVFLVLDAARSPSVLEFLDSAFPREEDVACLYSGWSAKHLWRVAPYLVEVDLKDARFLEFLRIGWGREWGILLLSPLEFRELRRRLRKLTAAIGPDGESLLVRFYDPRVIFGLLDTATPEQLPRWFDGVSAYLSEEDGGRTVAIGTCPDGEIAIRRTKTGIDQLVGYAR